MAQLYPAQAKVVDALMKGYSNPNLTMQHRLYISGEMGTGKTYMASAVVAQLKPKHVLIVCPSSMPKKWQKVYQEFNQNEPILFNKNMTKDEIIKTSCLIIMQKDLYTLIKILYNTHEQFEKNIKDIKSAIERLMRDTTDDIELPHDRYETYFDFAIFDEIHTYKPTTQLFRALAILSLTKAYFLGLTGTLFKQNIIDLHCLLNITNPDFNNLEYNNDNLRDPSWFYTNIWRYISVPINLHEIERQQVASENEIKQDIMPLEGLDLSDEQHAWYELANFNLKRLNLTKNRIDQVTTSYIDLPQNKQPSVLRSTNDNYVNYIDDDSENKNYYKNRTRYLSGMTLSPIAIEKTPKFMKLQSILQEHPDKTIIFIQDTNLGKVLADHLDRAFCLPASISKAEVEQCVNEKLANDYDILIATTKQISTGIDINNAHQVIWYQVPADVTAILQAQRRVFRLNSTNNSKVWFLYYKNTIQEQIITDVSKSATNNAAAYNVRAKDNLAKLTGILFGEIDND